MNARNVFLPVFALVFLNCIVWFWMYAIRILEMRKNRVDAQNLDTRRNAAGSLKETAPADNLMNLFEIPVLFYTWAIIVYLNGLLTPVDMDLAVLYVILRYGHSAIHLTYNKVMHRFMVYATSTLVLWVLWLKLAIATMRII